jgi:hypothetical protein
MFQLDRFTFSSTELCSLAQQGIEYKARSTHSPRFQITNSALVRPGREPESSIDYSGHFVSLRLTTAYLRSLRLLWYYSGLKFDTFSRVSLRSGSRKFCASPISPAARAAGADAGSDHNGLQGASLMNVLASTRNLNRHVAAIVLRRGSSICRATGSGG